MDAWRRVVDCAQANAAMSVRHPASHFDPTAPLHPFSLVQAVRPAVQELARLEHQAQTSFFLLKRKWAAVA